MKYDPRMVLHCAQCGKPLQNKPAGWIGDMAFGWVCFAKIKGAQVAIANRPVIRDELTDDLFPELENQCQPVT
jgi:hypothetical protein